MSNLDSLKNAGVLALNTPRVSPPEKTVIVLGTARGGTTMVASVLQALGVYMGEKLGPVMEDVTLSHAVESRDLERLREIVAQYNSAYPLWGWKRPSALEFSDVWQDNFRNPYIIAIFRDPFAIANRNRISMLADVFQSMESSIQHLGLMVKFLRQQKCPVLLCSYEKALASPETFVQAVDNFLALNAPALWDGATRQINPGSETYLEASRITQSLGHLDIVNADFCCGWAFYPLQPNKAANVQLFINDRLVYTGAATLPRPDVKEIAKHPTGYCGFKYEWPAYLPLKKGDRVEARIEGEVKPLKGSPKIMAEITKKPRSSGDMEM